MKGSDKNTLPAAKSSDPARNFSDQDLIARRYRVVRLIGDGGSAEVYEVTDTALHGEIVALKAMHASEAEDATSRERFRREIQLSRKVTHPNVCRIFDLGEHQKSDGTRTLFFTMEMLRGSALGDRLDPARPMAAEAFLNIASQIGAGLEAAHQAGVVHRDLKPGNIMLIPSADGSERVVLTDFGLARSDRIESSGITASGEFIGTPVYMSPEQVQCETVTRATDIYSFGVVLYEMLSGCLPFEDDAPLANALRRVHSPPTPIRKYVPDVEPVWEATVHRCLALKPHDRFSSAQDVVAALRGEIPPNPSKPKASSKLQALLRKVTRQ
jgi:serine/threonine protein kinase